VRTARTLPDGAFGPPAPDAWTWHSGAARRGSQKKGRGSGKAGHDRRKTRDTREPARHGKTAGKGRETGNAPGQPATGKAFAGLADLMKR
jgi:ATP-dependent RNA helicase SUPV3L1/SUV3